MSLNRSARCEISQPAWLWEYLGVNEPREDAGLRVGSQEFVLQRGIPRSLSVADAGQAQTERAFAYKWKQRESFETVASLARRRQWLLARYGDVSNAEWWSDYGEHPLVLDAGCGAGVSALELFGDLIPRVRYLCVDISDAIDVASTRFAERGLPAGFVQADVCRLPFRRASVHVIFSEGVLHHTPSTRAALNSLAPLLVPGGRMMFYVYRRKGPIREYTDDYIRAKLKSMSPEEAWKAMESLTRLGIALGELRAEIEVPESIELLGIPAGRINVQRLFYWHVAKAFFDPELSFETMNHINFDWYAPTFAHRQSPEEIRAWCSEAGLAIEREIIEDAGITIIAVRKQ
jgi:SAM-dependent methyltransferase